MNRKIASMKATKGMPVLVRNEEQDIGTSDVRNKNIFQILERYTYITAYDFSEPWGISLSQATKTQYSSIILFFYVKCNHITYLSHHILGIH